MQNKLNMFLKKTSHNFGIYFLIITFLFSCSKPPSYTRYTFRPDDNPNLFQKGNISQETEPAQIFKLHMKDATVYIMKNWNVIDKDSVVEGYGALFDVNRNLIKKDNFRIPVRDIALVETNESNSNPALIALTIVTAASLAMTVYCIYNPKTCFGSCPTFYAWDGKEMRLQAEGFSGAVAPSLEEADVDALYFAKPENGNLRLKMTNEALETHVVRYADIIVVPKPESSRVFVTQEGKFYKSDKLLSPYSAVTNEGDCRDKVLSFDNNERFSKADSNDLSAKETIELTFNNQAHGSKGLILAFRQTLMTTFLFYSALSYMGSSACDYLAMLERSEGTFMRNVTGSKEILGGIRVFIENDKGVWDYHGEFFELGPISTDVQMMQLGTIHHGKCKIRLEMTKGLWRIDFAALAENCEEVQPIRIQPSYVIKENEHDPKALEELRDNSKILATLPGDEYIINYKLPDESQSYEFFLESRGYYLEWLRKEWLKDENPVLLSKLILTPEQYFKDIAPEYKKAEPTMEDAFWRSKYVKKQKQEE